MSYANFFRINQYSLNVFYASFLISILVSSTSMVKATGNYYSLATKWGSYGSGDSQFKPGFIAVDSSGSVYVVDQFNNRIQKFTSTGTFITKWGSQGSGDGQFQTPLGIAVDPSGNVYVVDANNNRIQKFTPDGKFLMKWGSLGTSNGQFNQPSGVAVDPLGNVYVTDVDTIQKFTSNGTFITIWGSPGRGDGQFQSPVGIAVDPSGNVYVVDANNNRIQKFTSTGTFITKWGSQGSGDGQFQTPLGIAVDPSGNVYVVDANNNRIQKFSSNGTFLGTVDILGVELHLPGDVTTDRSGHIYVADTGNNRIVVFSSPLQTGKIIPSTQTTNSTAKIKASTEISSPTHNTTKLSSQNATSYLPTRAAAPAASTKSFSEYKNPRYKFTISYPSNWRENDSLSKFSGAIVRFASPDSNSEVYVNLWRSNKSLSEVTNDITNSLPHKQIIESTPTTLAGNSAHEILYNNVTYDTLEVWTIKAGNLYNIVYYADPASRYSTELPTIQGIINSFQIMNSNLKTSPSSSTINSSQNFAASENRASLGPSANQSETKVKTPQYLTYQNSTYGIKIQYPSTWQVVDNTTAVNSTDVTVADFSDPSTNATVDVHVDTNVSKALDLDTYLADSIQLYKQDKVDLPDFTVVKSDSRNAVLLGIPAYELLYTNTDPIYGTVILHDEIGTIIGGKAFYLNYFVDIPKYSLYRHSVVDRMLNSLQIDMQPSNGTQSLQQQPTNSNVPEI